MDESGSNLGRVVVQADSKLNTVRQLIKMFLSGDLVAFHFVTRGGDAVTKKEEPALLAYEVLHPPTEEGTLPVLTIRYARRGRPKRPEQRYS